MKEDVIGDLAPIVLFVYNRPWHTKQTIKALQKNKLADKSELFIYSDGAKDKESEKKVKEVREYIKTIEGFKKVTIIEREQNLGLANNIIDGVTNIINRYGKIIVLEDDLVSSPYFLKFMNEALEFYENDEKIMSISGYCYPFVFPKTYDKDVFLFYRFSSWGWAMWKDRWNKIDFNISKNHHIFKNKKLKKQLNRGGEDLFDLLKSYVKGRNDSWAIRVCLNVSLNNKYTLYPRKSLIQNIGFDASGTHCGINNKWNVILDNNFYPYLKPDIEIDINIVQSLQKVFQKNIFQKIKSLIKGFIT